MDELDKQMKSLQKDQREEKLKSMGNQFRFNSDIWKLNQTIDEIAKIETPIGTLSLKNTYLWVILGIIILVIIVSIIIWRIKKFFCAKG